MGSANPLLAVVADSFRRYEAEGASTFMLSVLL